MKIITLIMSLLMTAGITQTSFASDGAGRLKEIQIYNLEDGLALQGYDPVSFFPEGGSEGLKGSDEFSMEFGGVTYLFANQANLDTFVNEAVSNKTNGVKTLKYEPTYGGWCAYAMGAIDDTIPINVKFFDFTGDRLHFFVNAEALALWKKDTANLEKKADRNWRKRIAKARRN